MVHRGGPGRLRQALREVRLPLPTPDAIQVRAVAHRLITLLHAGCQAVQHRTELQQIYRLLIGQVFTQDAEPAGRQVPGAGVHGDGGEGLLLQVPGVRDRHAQRNHEQLHAGPQDHLHPGGEPLRAGAAPGAGQRAPPRLPQGQGPPRRIVRIDWHLLPSDDAWPWSEFSLCVLLN